jgi:arsenite methyltransferase
MTHERPDYGIDAPGVVRNLFLVGGAGFALWGTALFGVRTGRFVISNPVRVFAGIGFNFGVLCTLMGIWMLWESKIGKLRGRERLLQRIPWTGGEQVLDVGCGRGLILIGAAKRLTTGKATGIDIWQAVDLSGNGPEAAIENARREGVAERVTVQTADMRKIPFGDNVFDVVVSRAAIHNLYNAHDRDQAIAEIARVLKPGGRALIEDIRHHSEYTQVFAQNGCADVQRFGSPVVRLLWTILTFGSVRPATLIVRKSA